MSHKSEKRSSSPFLFSSGVYVKESADTFFIRKKIIKEKDKVVS